MYQVYNKKYENIIKVRKTVTLKSNFLIHRRWVLKLAQNDTYVQVTTARRSLLQLVPCREHRTTDSRSSVDTLLGRVSDTTSGSKSKTTKTTTLINLKTDPIRPYRGPYNEPYKETVDSEV